MNDIACHTFNLKLVDLPPVIFSVVLLYDISKL